MSSIAELLAEARAASLEDAPLLLAHVLDRDRSWLFAWPEYRLSEPQLNRYLGLLERRRQGEPLAYLTGHREFWSLELEVNPAVLIPRPETELLVELALALDLPTRSRVLELGTGSGAIAIALASERPDWHITATDASTAALDVARRNARRHGLSRIRFTRGDWYHALQSGEGIHLIVSNPPYVRQDDPHLREDGLPWEPEQALAAGSDGLADLRAIIGQAPEHLLPGGWLLVEHGLDQGDAVRTLFGNAGFTQVSTRQDLGGRDRVTLGCYPPSP
ncbi:peptide chain release factor N(5)-glutamine methyltransferase [Thiolapillus sp.]